jgi:anti-sigma factor RsiW
MARRPGDEKMKLTQNVIMDLLPVYLAGEASADTNELVEEFMRQDPEVARAIESQRRDFGAQQELLKTVCAPSADHELRTLAQTRLRMERQKWLMALALMLTAFPFSFVFGDHRLIFLIVRDQPELAAASWLGAAILWVLYFVARRRLRVTGL